MKIAIYPGSFDPITSGHLNIIQRAANIFDRLIVCVMVNSSKVPMFTRDERVALIRRVVGNLPNVEVDSSEIESLESELADLESREIELTVNVNDTGLDELNSKLLNELSYSRSEYRALLRKYNDLLEKQGE